MKYDIINANTYEDISNYLIIPQEDKLFTPEFLRKDGIILCKTDYIDYLFNNIQFSPHKYVLITVHSDYPIDIFRFSKKPKCIKKWFSYNVMYDHPDLIPIPVGIYTHRGFTQNVYIKFDIKWFEDNLERLKNNKKILDTVYCNWAVTNEKRNKIIDLLKNKGIKYKWETGLPFETYCENMSRYKFIISPQGNAEDTYTFRTWEAMHFGCIPIVTKTRLYKDCTELPMIQLNDYNELSYDIMNSYLTKEFNTEKMYMTYWRNLIVKTFNEL